MRLCLGTPAGTTRSLNRKMHSNAKTTLPSRLTYIRIWLAHVGFMFDAPPVVYAKLYIYGNKSYTVYKN